MIENAPAARPQTNLQKADVVYEALAEGSITRFFCVFNDNMPEDAGPVRSLRRYYMNMQKEWDSIIIHCGGAKNPGSQCFPKGFTLYQIAYGPFKKAPSPKRVKK